MDGGNFAAGDADFGADVVVWFTGEEAEAGDAGDAGDGLATEAEGADGHEVFGVAEFAGGVAFEGEEGVFAAHAAAVVANFDEVDAALGDGDFDFGGVGIEAIFHEFFHDGGGALDDFAGGDLAGEDVWEYVNFGHGRGSVREKTREE